MFTYRSTDRCLTRHPDLRYGPGKDRKGYFTPSFPGTTSSFLELRHGANRPPAAPAAALRPAPASPLPAGLAPHRDFAQTPVLRPAPRAGGGRDPAPRRRRHRERPLQPHRRRRPPRRRVRRRRHRRRRPVRRRRGHVPLRHRRRRLPARARAGPGPGGGGVVRARRLPRGGPRGGLAAHVRRPAGAAQRRRRPRRRRARRAPRAGRCCTRATAGCRGGTS